MRELDRIRGLVLQIPTRQENVLPINTVVDSIWRLQQQLRYLLRLHSEGQLAFAQKAAELAHASAHEAEKHQPRLKAMSTAEGSSL